MRLPREACIRAAGSRNGVQVIPEREPEARDSPQGGPSGTHSFLKGAIS